MKSYDSRLKRIEGHVGVSVEVKYLVIAQGYRRIENGMHQGRPFFRCPDGKVKQVISLMTTHTGKAVGTWGPETDEGKEILKSLGYELVTVV